MERSILGGICGVLLVTAVTACGGTVLVSPGKGTPREQLQSNGPERCKAACVTVASCGLGSKSCDCACPPCAAGSTSCECPPCECTQDSTSPEKCESDCNDSVQQMLKDEPDCDSPMLALLDCLAAATCNANEEPCKTEQAAMKGCGEHASSPPTAAGGSDPGSSSGSSGSAGGSSSGSGTAGSSGTGASGAATCTEADGLAGTSPRGTLPPPGTVICHEESEVCTDGHSYGVYCVATTSAVMTCSCAVDNTATVNFPSTTCVQNLVQASAPCGWNLR